jgi:hypothetical protein
LAGGGAAAGAGAGVVIATGGLAPEVVVAMDDEKEPENKKMMISRHWAWWSSVWPVTARSGVLAFVGACNVELWFFFQDDLGSHGVRHCCGMAKKGSVSPASCSSAIFSPRHAINDSMTFTMSMRYCAILSASIPSSSNIAVRSQSLVPSRFQ